MQVSVETTEGLERKMTIAVPGGQVDSAVNERLQEATKTIQLKGFRKGKVPFKVVKSKFGKGVRAEVINELMSRTYYDALNQESLKPAGQPKIEPTNIEEGNDLEFVATFEVYPEIALPDFSKIKIDRLSAEVTDKDIDEMVETLREQRQTWEVVEREAADKDMVNIDYLGKKGGEEFEGGAAQGTNLVLGSERMIPGFEAGIVGKKAGEAFTIPLTFPEEYHSEDLAGQSVEFDITLNSVSEQALPEVNETFYKSFGVEEGGEEAFRAEVSNNMKREMKTASRNKVKNKVMDALIDIVDVGVPAALVSAEIDQLKVQAMQQMGGGQGADPSMLPDDLFKEQANRRVVLGLVLGEVIKEKNIQADPAKVRAQVEELAATYESPEDVINWYYGNKEQLASIESTVIEDQVFDYIIEEAAVTDKQVSYQEVIKPEPRAADAEATQEES
ncbi:MAG: trigger factor [Gammaproteobacteria bacterium]|nr:trigger factor [Gammaproteobacteria bacterium]MDD9894666.1 trigger factor [Gammaproteobacteria bacterium]MDD9960222.1 trigger factor [Gammaproteobacteria bacterium]